MNIVEQVDKIYKQNQELIEEINKVQLRNQKFMDENMGDIMFILRLYKEKNIIIKDVVQAYKDGANAIIYEFNERNKYTRGTSGGIDYI